MKIRHLTPTILLLSFCAASPTVGSAQAAPQPSAEFLDQAEVRNAAEAKFDKLDADHDGTVDRKEIGASFRKAFAKADTDSDGTIDKAEYLSLVDAKFKAADTDHDGTISEAELNTKAGHALARLIR
jgi:Ca2+-binding EF-hand superfamily protein